MSLVDRQTTIPLTVIDPEGCGSCSLEVEFGWCPGREPSGMSGPPENYDPGDGPEIEIRKVTREGDETPLTLNEDQEEALAEWIACNFVDLEQDDGPYPEDYYDDRDG